MQDDTCSFDGCERRWVTRGLCDMHYRRALRAGRLPPRVGRNRSPERHRQSDPARFFWSHAKVVNAAGCWEWTGRTSPKGYGVMPVNRRPVQAHRFAYELLIGPIPAGLQTDHLCHTNDVTCPGGDHVRIGAV